MAALDLNIQDGVATLTMNRPEARNALSPDMKDDFARLLPQLAQDPAVRALVLTGAGGAFCAGGDIRSMSESRAGMTVEGWRQRMQEINAWARQLLEFEKPVVTAVDGSAFGAGFGLALAGDCVIASTRARFCMSFMRIGLVPDCGASYTLPRVVGVQRARELMLSAREVGAEEAQRLGIAMEVVAPEALLPRALELARSFAQASPLAVSLVKAKMGAALATDLNAALAAEANDQALCFMSAYNADSVERFLAKQPPRFTWPAVKG